MLPASDRKEWLELIAGSIDPPLSSHLLKIRLSTLRKKVRLKLITREEAARELYKDCLSHEDIYRNDLYVIFRQESAKYL
jgi:hypothetical protein